MARAFTSARAICAAILVAGILLAGCGSHSSSDGDDGGSINPAALFTDISKSIQQPITRELSGWDWDSFILNFGDLLINFRYTLDMQKITYESTGADGKMHTMTGLLILPKAIIGSKPAVPILMYQHGTEVYRQFSPSRYLSHKDKPTDYPEVMVAAAIAATGYAVALVDYEGMGDNTDTQPHVVGAVLAQQVIDLLKASRDTINENRPGSGKSPCSWNGQLFLMGYSEGGYVTMAVTRELQLNHADEFTITASAPLAGPHDLSGVMRGIILSDNTFKAPYFIPMVLTSYSYAYGGQTTFFSPDYAMLPPYNITLPPLFNGNTQSDAISEAMGMTFSPVHLIVPKSTLTQQFIDQLTSDASPVVALLKQNDSYRLPVLPNSVWVPTVPMRMIHHKQDDLVPYANSQVAYDAFIAAGSTKVQLVEETDTINISSDPVKTVHAAAAFPILVDGWNWIEGYKK
jgi:hypothetical protein